MKMKVTTGICVSLLALSVGTGYAKPTQQKPAVVQLNNDGERLEKKYSTLLADLKVELGRSVPVIDAQKQAAFLKAIEADRAALENLKAKQAAHQKATNLGLLRHREGWVKKAQAAVKEATKKVEEATAASKATNSPENAAALKTAEERLTKDQANLDLGLLELKKCQEAAEQGKLEAPRLEAAVKAAQAEKDNAKLELQNALKAVSADTGSVVKSGTLDGKLMKFVILNEATPRGLASFAQQGREQEALVDKLLSDDALMKQMLISDGAEGGKYGQAMQIYADIQKASPKAQEGAFQRLALATALVHATPIAQSNPQALTNAPATVDPISRYQHFEKAFIDGELDSVFKDLTVWDYRMVVDGDEPNETLAWGREMLRNYRPDLIATSDFRWRYVESVKTDCKYGSQEVKNDLPTLQAYQNMIMNGGVCGRRAFFGRFILRAFGVPTIARPSPGHAALAHWTPEGWVINLGGGWGAGTTKTRYEKDTDFLEVTQARTVESSYMELQRAHWLGDLAGESRIYGLESSKKGVKAGFWNYFAVCRRQEAAQESKAKTLAAVGTDLGESNESKEKEVIASAKISDADRRIVMNADGSITIPAAACSKPTNSTGRIRFMPSRLGGMQLHYTRLGKAAEPFEYTVDLPAAGKYALTAQVVTNSVNQQLSLVVNDAKEPINIAIPFTTGKWDKTPAVEVALVKGKNVLRFSREEDAKGLSIKDFTVVPTK